MRSNTCVQIPKILLTSIPGFPGYITSKQKPYIVYMVSCLLAAAKLKLNKKEREKLFLKKRVSGRLAKKE